MTALREKIIFGLLFLAWLPLLAALWPYPTHEVAAKQHAAFQILLDNVNSEAKILKDEKGLEIKEFNDITKSFPTVDELKSQLQLSWVIKLTILIFGCFSVFYAARKFKGWKYLLIAASVFYLLLGYSLEWSMLFQSDYWLGLWYLATDSEIWGVGVMYREFIFPVFHVFFIFAILLSLFINKNDLTSHPSGR